MGQYEYKVIPSPVKGLKGGDDKSVEGRFAYAIETAINDMASDGWEYIRSDLLPSQERQGLTGSKTVYRNLLVFRRALSVTLAKAPSVSVSKSLKPAPQPEATAEVVAAEPVATVVETEAEPAAEPVAEAAKEPAKAPALKAERAKPATAAEPAKTKVEPKLQSDRAASDGFLDDD